MFGAGDTGDQDPYLVTRALGGQQPAYSALLARHRDAVFRLARHHVGDESEALDVTQEAFVSAFAALARYDPARPFRAWLLRIALNKCR
ncbi:MAG: RNA polymerase sigma factor, partial [Novosphingobium sp.]